MSNVNNIPSLRFPGFSGEWEEKKMCDVFARVTKKNTENNGNVLTISSQYGLISQLDFFKKSVASADVSGYYLLQKGDFAYNKSSSQGKPVGAIKPLKLYDKGVVSTLYICFRCKNPREIEYWDQYFEAGILDKEIMSIAQEGARNHGLLNVSTTEFFNLPVRFPSLPEQQKIAECLSAVDESILAQQEKVDALKAKKKGLMQQLFPQEGETTPRLRFPGFTGEWELFTVHQLCSVNRGIRITRRDLINNGNYPVFQNTTSPLGYYNHFNVKANNPFVIIGGSAGTIGFCKTDFWAADDCAYFGDNNNMDKFFLYLSLLLHTSEIKDNVRGGNIPRIDRKSLENLRISLPPTLSEQRKIASCISSLDETIAAEEQKVEALKSHKKGLMQQLFPQPSK